MLMLSKLPNGFNIVYTSRLCGLHGLDGQQLGAVVARPSEVHDTKLRSSTPALL